MNDPDRQTGRTTRTIQCAIYSAKHGHDVIVFIHSQAELYYIRKLAGSLNKGVVPDNIKFLTTKGLKEFQLPPCPDNAVVFIDHYAIQKMSLEEITALENRRYIK